MMLKEFERGVLNDEAPNGSISAAVSVDQLGEIATSSSQNQGINDGENGVQLTCFTENLNDVSFHVEIIRLQKQIYAWIGCNSAKFGHLYAAALTRPNNTVSVTSILGGSSDNTGSSIARRLALKTGLNIILACNIPKNSPLLEADAERILIQKLSSLGYIRSKPHGHTSMGE